MTESGTFTLPDGRTLQFIRGPQQPDDALLLYHHGTPAAGPLDRALVHAAGAAGFTLVELVRPGYADSTRMPGRRVSDVVPLAAALADHCGVERFATLGWSGGGPHALATAALLPDRCVAAVSLASVAPYDADGLDFLAGMGEDNIVEFGAALASESELEAFMAHASGELADITGDDVVQALASLLPDADRAYLTGESAEAMAEQLRWSLSTGWWGWFDDDISFITPWGFTLSDIRVPIVGLQGTDDLMVPVSHGRWLAERLAPGSMRILPGDGHLSIVSSLERELAALRPLLP